MDHKFTGPRYTIGIEEELMILDAETLELANAIEAMLEDPAVEGGEIKPELHESVLEVATQPCRTTAEAAEQLRGLRAAVREKAASRGYTIGSAGTHPFAMWEDQRIVARPRYRELVTALRFVARQELIFGMHVHVGLDDPDKAIYVANGMRVHLAVLLALSANSPFWRADSTGLLSTRRATRSSTRSSPSSVTRPRARSSPSCTNRSWRSPPTPRATRARPAHACARCATRSASGPAATG